MTGRATASEPSLIVICAANPYDAIKMADQHLAEEFARRGPVLYVDPPISWLSPYRDHRLAASSGQPRLRRIGPNLMRFTPLVQPGVQRPGLGWLTESLVRRALGSTVRSLAMPVDTLISAWPMIGVFGACGERQRVYWAQDDFVAGAPLFGLSPARIAAGEKRVAAAAGAIVASNPAVAEMWRLRGYQPHLIPFGCDSSLFADSDSAALPEEVRLPGPIAGFIGHLGSRIDLRLLEAVADRGRSLLLVGPAHPRVQLEGLAALLARPNVQWVGAKSFEELPSYQRLIDVGLVPYSASPFNIGSFPLKTLEYLAAGRRVVATDLPATRWLNTNLITIASDPGPFADAVDRLLDDPLKGTMKGACREFAARHSWSARAETFGRILELPWAGKEKAA